MTRIIVNADDLGMNSMVNESTLELLEQGLITSSSLLVNAPCFDAGARAACKTSAGSFGVHLNLTEFEPLSDRRRLEPLLTDGVFDANKIRRIRITPTLMRAVYDEWCAQVIRTQSYGLELTHFDSHHHVHTVPGLFPVLKAVQRRFKIRRVRLSKNVYSDRMPTSARRLRIKRLWNGALRRVYRTYTTDSFTEFHTFLELPPSQIAVHGDFEVMVHPGDPEQQAETSALAGDWRERLCPGARLISYREL